MNRNKINEAIKILEYLERYSNIFQDEADEKKMYKAMDLLREGLKEE